MSTQLAPATGLLGERLAAAEDLLRTAPPAVTVETAERIARDHFGCAAQAQLLSGERDRNFLLTAADGARFVLKFSNPADDAQIRALQNGVLLHIEARDPSCPVPRLIPTRDGAAEALLGADELRLPGQGPIAATLITCLPGANPTRAQISPAQRASVGRILGQLSAALADYDHPCLDRAILWDMMNVGQLQPLVALIDDKPSRDALAAWTEAFDETVAAPARAFEAQAIHNDSSQSNLMVAASDPERITGLIDFGDIVRGPRINDLAVAASYFVPTGDEPEAQTIDLAHAFADVINGIAPEHRAHLPLSEAEITLFPALVQARLATRILISGWRAQLFPENRAYILRSNRAAWGLWERMIAAGPAALSARLLDLTIGGR